MSDSRINTRVLNESIQMGNSILNKLIDNKEELTHIKSNLNHVDYLIYLSNIQINNMSFFGKIINWFNSWFRYSYDYTYNYINYIQPKQINNNIEMTELNQVVLDDIDTLLKISKDINNQLKQDIKSLDEIDDILDKQVNNKINKLNKKLQAKL